VIWALLCLLVLPCLGLAAWVVILPPRDDRDGFEEFDLRESARWERDN
jgi:hypothetical protein